MQTLISGRLPELLLPAGSFDSGIAAIEGGADALYLGFSDFSARKQAKNFDRLQYRRLYRLAREKGIKLYIALNTVILQDEMEKAARLLAFLRRFPPDAVIVQDWGIARVIRNGYPEMAIHASTQTAVQGARAARIARELGASRIVLPRETSLAEMKRLAEEEPGIEYESFVHGALCYSFSGLCLASGLVLGRSGNRGECAQLCRSYYRLEGRDAHWFSCRDLDLGDWVGELAAAGISSLKVEGRMKSPEYCYAAASLYRGLIDRLAGKGPDEEELYARREAVRLAFSRDSTQGWISERGGAGLIDPDYPGQRGVSAGRIVSSAEGRVVLDLTGPLCLRDGLLGFERGDPSRAAQFPVLELREARSGRELVRARAGTRVELLALSEGRPIEGLRAGDELRRISSRDLDRKAPSREEYEASREELRLRLFISGEGIAAEPNLPGHPRIEAGGAMALERARTSGGLERALSIFGESGEADFRLEAELDGEAQVLLTPGADGTPRFCAAADLFIPPSALKREKNRIYSRTAELVAEAEAAAARQSVVAASEVGERSSLAPSMAREEMPREWPPRAALVFPREGLPSGMPFANPRDLATEAALPAWGGRSWLPLAPLVADREAYSSLVRFRVASVLEAGEAIAVGLGALHHFPIARDLVRQFPGAGRRLAFFLDVNLYVANHLAWASLSELVPGVEFAYRYLELPCGSDSDTGTALATVGPGFEPPLFQSLGCFYKHHVVRGVCPDRCPRNWSATLSDRARRYRVVVEDCVTTLFRIEKEKGRSP